MNIELNRKMIPAVTLRGLTILPDMIIHFDLSRERSILAVEQAMMLDQVVFLVTQKDSEEEEPGYDQVYAIGTTAKIKQVTKLPNNIVRVLVEGLNRGKLLSFDAEHVDYLLAEVEEITEQENQKEMDAEEHEAMLRHIKELFVTYSLFYPKVGQTMSHQINEITELGRLLDQLTINLPIAYEKKQMILEAVAVKNRYEELAKILYEESEIAKVRNELSEKIKNRVEKNQKEYLLREQLNFIREELGDRNSFSDSDQFEEELKKCKASKEVKDKIKKEIARFKSVSGNSSESAVERGYIETLLELPWDRESKDNTDLNTAEAILNEEHYGLFQVKERILEFLAVRNLTKQGEGPIICLVGPPGTGKTSIARSVANALNKKYVRISLGGVRDEAEIRGHRKTYVGAMPGRIATGLKQAGVKNPLMLLDEIDKVSSDYKGDTSAALLEVLDSEQNNRFRDHYVEIPLDLSSVLFIATANSTAEIPRPLLDRMEIIEVSSYTANEKYHIAKRFLLEKQLRKSGLDKERLQISDSAIKEIIQNYTRESGVRELERKIGEICRKAAKEMLQQKKKGCRVTAGNLSKYLGKRKYLPDKINKTDEIGIVRGLAWTSVGGDTLQIEVNMMPGKGEIELTGQMGDVMKESAITGISYIRSVSKEYGVSPTTFSKNDFHIHIPEGAVPKDGPSAGITMATALLSAITETPVRANLAMTGEITLRGRVLPIGGLKEKILAAKMAGIKTVLVPKDNEKDIDEISKEIKSDIEILFMESMKEVIEQAFVGPIKKAAGRKDIPNGN